MSQENIEPPTAAASAGPACWAGVLDTPMLETLGLKKFGSLPDGPQTLYSFETKLGVTGCFRLGDGAVFVKGQQITAVDSMAQVVDLLRLLRFFA